MPSTETANFLRVALDIQAEPYAGIHVAGGLIAATDGVMLVAARWGEDFLRGEGAISPKSARVLEALAESAWIGRIEVDGNRVTATAQITRYDEKLGEEVAGEYQPVVLPEFYCRQIPIRRMVGVLTDAEAGWRVLAMQPKLKALKEAGARDYVALVEEPGDGRELFRPKSDEDAQWYSVAQLRRGLRLFGAKARLNVRRNAKGWLAFEDVYGCTFALTPFVKYD